MAAWIIGIDRENPEHWGFAKEHEYWDMTVHRPFEPGDSLYFWQAGGSLLGSVEVTQGTCEIVAGTSMPWNLDDAKRDDYRHRVHFRVLEPQSAGQPRWSELTAATGVRGATNFGPRRVPAAGELWLAAQVTGMDAISPSVRSVAEAFDLLIQGMHGDSVSAWERDFRTRVEAAIVIRRGQPLFRRSLLTAYHWKCAVTGTAIEGILEAAHISPYRGEHTNTPSNGLLLRSDIHTLFDLHAITVLPDLTVRVAPDARTEPYAAYEGRPLVSIPKRMRDRPSHKVLAKHNESCTWL